jgi:hypothetical protein
MLAIVALRLIHMNAVRSQLWLRFNWKKPGSSIDGLLERGT